MINLTFSLGSQSAAHTDAPGTVAICLLAISHSHSWTQSGAIDQFYSAISLQRLSTALLLQQQQCSSAAQPSVSTKISCQDQSRTN